MQIEARAKINYTLAVGPVRADGYHSLRSIVLPIPLADELVFTPAPAFATDTGYGEKDLIWKAARALMDAAGRAEMPRFAVHVAKRIPTGGGLGGGSADAAAALKALNGLLALGFSTERLMEIGAKVGSDVPALVFGRPCWMEGRGEIVRPLEPALEAALAPVTRHLVLANPGINSSTAAVYKACSPTALRPYSPTTLRPYNDLTAPACALYPAISRLLADMGEDAQMSGSGATCWRSCASAAEADALVRHLASLGYWCVTPSELF